MRQTKTFLKVVLLFVLALNVIMYGAVQASVDTSYGMATDLNNGIIKDTTLQQATPVNFAMDFSQCTGYTYTTVNNSIIEDEGYLCYTLPDSELSNLNETLIVTCYDAAVNGQGTRYDLRITISNMFANGYKKSKGKGKNLRIFAMIGSGADRAPWIEGYITSGGGVQDIFTSISYDVTMQIVDKNGTVQNGTFVYAVKDLDISDSNHNYGDASEGVTLLGGFTPGTLKVKTDSILCYKYIGGGIRLTGTKSNDYTDRNTGSEEAGTEAGFSVIANAAGLVFNWTSGRNCGTALCDFGQPSTMNLIIPDPPSKPTTVTAYYRWINEPHSDAYHAPETKTPGVAFGPEALSNFYYTGKYSWRYSGVNSIAENVEGSSVTIPYNELDNQVIFWYQKNAVTIRYRNIDYPNQEILDSHEVDQGATVPKKDKAGWAYVGVSVTKPNEKPIIRDNAIDLSVGNMDATEVTFWYRQTPPPVPQKVTVRHRNFYSPHQDLCKSEQADKGATVIKKEFANWEYVGVSVTVPSRPMIKDKAINLSVDNMDAVEVTFWYKESTPPPDPNPKTVTVRYRNINEPKQDLKGIRIVNQGETVDKENIEGWKYVGVSITEPNRPIVEDQTINLSNNKDAKEVTFWYREIPSAKARYVVIKKETDDFTKGRDVFDPKIKSLTEDVTFDYRQIYETGRNYDYVGMIVDNGKPTKDGTVKFTDDGKNHEVVFAYVQIVNIKVIGVCGQNNKLKQFALEKDVPVPINKTYKARDYEWKGYKLVEGNNARVVEGTLTWSGETANLSGGTANVNVSESNYSNSKKSILVIFYYESIFKATVKHIYVNPLTNEETVLEIGTISIVPDVNKTFSSKKFSNYINLSYTASPNVTITPNGFAKYGDNLYNISFVPGEANYTIEFRYTSQVIEVRHEYEDGTPVIPPVIKILDPENPESPIPKKEVVYYQLNGGPKQEPVTTVKVPIKPGQEKQTLVFVYTTPYLIFGEEDPNPDHPYYPDGDTYANTRKKYNTGIFPNKMNNQLIGQSGSVYYWVLDEKGELTIRLAYKHMNDGTSNATVSVKIPFDVYINGTLFSANTPISVNINRKAENDAGCEVWEGKLSNIQIPVWTQEKEYTIEAIANYKHVASDGYTTPITGTATAKVIVIGAIYDFSVTNIDGSKTTGDEMWKASLFTNPILKAVASMTNKEYETNILPIGQANQQNAKYSYGIKKGTRFYFSVNTKGAKSTSIEITPRFYYFDKAGNIGNNGNPITVRFGNADITTLTRTTSLTDDNRTTREYQKELAQGRTTYGANTYSNAKPTIFANKVITIGTGLRTPFVNYGKDSTSSKYHEVSAMTDVNRVYRSASHWYADYVIPNNATFYDSSNKQLANDGYVVVGFSIRTKAGNDAYLAYSLYSPFTATKQTEWAYEGAPSSYTLPKTLSLTTGKSATPWLRNVVTNVSNPSAFAPVAIYQFSAGNTGTLQNVDSAGTH